MADSEKVPRPGICPHCSSLEVDRGATGLDECRACGGLSRDGKPLERADERLRRLEAFARHVIAIAGDVARSSAEADRLAELAREALG